MASGSSFVRNKNNFKAITSVYDEAEKTKAIKRRKYILAGGIHPEGPTKNEYVTTESP